MNEPGRVAVIGAGPAGLAAAHALAGAGRRVVLYEERDVPGGRLRTDVLDGASADVAVQMLSSTYHGLLGMAGSLGASGGIVRTAGRDAIWRKGRPHTIAFGSVSSMIVSSALPSGLKLRMAARYLPFLARAAKRLDANDPAGTGGADLDDASIAAWGVEHLGEDFVELLAYPLLGAYFGATPEQTSAALYHALARVGLDVQLLAVRGGVGELAEAIVGGLRQRGVEMRAGTRVQSVQPDAAGVTIVAAGAHERFDGVVIAVPATKLTGLYEPPPRTAAWLTRVRTAPTATVALYLRERLKVDWFGLSFPRESEPGRTLVALSVQSSKAADLVPPDQDVLVAFPAPAIAHVLAEAEAGTAVERLIPAIEMVFPDLRQAVVRARVHRFKEGYTLFEHGFIRHVRDFDPGDLPTTVTLAGDYLVAPTVEGAVISGQRAASLLLKRAKAADPE